MSGVSASAPISLRIKASVGGALIGSFMAVLNIQVVNTSLPDIQGGIGAGLDNGGWISTAYLIGEIIVIPLSGWLTEVFSFRRYLIGSTWVFLFFSVACGLAENFQQMVVLRALQGFSGGVLIPLALTAVITMLPDRAKPVGFALYALTATFAPAIGPTIGGAITDIYGWRYIFFLNLVPGAIMLPALIWGLAPSAMQLSKLRHGDWPGIFLIAVSLASLQVVLEEGNKDDWFGSTFILRLSVISAIAFGLFLFNALRQGNKNPVVNLRLLKQRNFAFASVSNVMFGLVLYGAVYLIPIYLSQSHGYSARQSGATMAWIGLPQLILIPFMPYLMRHFDSRLMLGSGFVLFSISLFMNMSLGPNDSGPQLLIPNLIRALGQSMIFPTILSIATAGIARKDTGSASGLFNMMRNLGGAVGIAGLQTFITNREKFHSAIMSPRVSLLAPATQGRLLIMQRYFQARGLADPGAARHQAIIAIGQVIRGQAYYLAYGDAFALLGACMLIGALAVLFLRKADAAPAPGTH